MFTRHQRRELGALQTHRSSDCSCPGSLQRKGWILLTSLPTDVTAAVSFAWRERRIYEFRVCLVVVPPPPFFLISFLRSIGVARATDGMLGVGQGAKGAPGVLALTCWAGWFMPTFSGVNSSPCVGWGRISPPAWIASHLGGGGALPSSVACGCRSLARIIGVSLTSAFP